MTSLMDAPRFLSPESDPAVDVATSSSAEQQQQDETVKRTPELMDQSIDSISIFHPETTMTNCAPISPDPATAGAAANNHDDPDDNDKIPETNAMMDSPNVVVQQQQPQPPSHSPAATKKRAYPVGAIVYKKFDNDWYFGFISQIIDEMDWYRVRYEDGDGEDLDELQVAAIVVTNDSGPLQIAAQIAGVDAEALDAKALFPPSNHPPGTSDIVRRYPHLLGHLDPSFLDQMIAQRQGQNGRETTTTSTTTTTTTMTSQLPPPQQQQQQQQQQNRKEGFPKYPLGTIVYKYFEPSWFFGHVTMIDATARLYGVDYEDGDREELDQREISGHVVVLGGATFATTSRQTCCWNNRQEWIERPRTLNEVKSPGSVNVVRENELFFNLDVDLLAEYIAQRQQTQRNSASKKKKKKKRDSLSAKAPKRLKLCNDYPSISSVDVRLEGNQFSPAVLEFFRLMHERQSMWVRRRKQSELTVSEPGERALLSTDPIFNWWHFCNVYRELDRGTTYFHSQMLNLRYSVSENAGESMWDEKLWLESVLWSSYVYRQVNRIETFQALGGIPSIDKVAEFSSEAVKLAARGTFFTGAHQTTNIHTLLENLQTFQGKEGGKLFREITSRIYSAESVQKVIVVLRSLNGIGAFLSWQILCDLRESKCLCKLDADDYCQLGPGAMKGLDVLLGNGEKVDYLEQARKLVKIQDEAFQQAGVQFPYWQGRKLSMKEIEHFLCELSKYASIKCFGRGRNYISRCPMDRNKPCFICKEARRGGSLCDTCSDFFCEACLPVPRDQESASFLCARCVKFGQHVPVC